MTIVRLAALLAILSIAPAVHAHGYLQSPRSRQFVAFQDGRDWGGDQNTPQKEYEPWSANKKAPGETCGTIGGRNYDFPKNALGGALAPRVQVAYNCGQQIDVDVRITAHHKGHFVLKACPISPGQTASQACFDRYRLRFISGQGANFDPNYPDRAYLPPYQGGNTQGWTYRYRFQLPAGLSGDLVLLQWHYITANSCLPPGYDRYNFPQGWHPGNLPVCGPLSSDGSGFPEQVSTEYCAHLREYNKHIPECNNHVSSC
jgi:hypothetical protein